MKRLFALVFLSVFALIDARAFPLRKKPAFHKGYVVMLSGDTIACELRFTRRVTEGLVQLRFNGRTSILTVKDIASFAFEDKAKQRTRIFYNVSVMPTLSTRKHEIFVEVLHEAGGLKIVNHRTLGYPGGSLELNPFRKKVITDNFYLYHPVTGITLPLSRENLLVLLNKNEKPVADYIDLNGLRLKSLSDYIAVLDYHGSLN